MMVVVFFADDSRGLMEVVPRSIFQIKIEIQGPEGRILRDYGIAIAQK